MHYGCMATLQIRDVPEGVYRLLRQRATEQRRSLTQEAVIVLEAGLAVGDHDERIERRRRVLAMSASNPIGLPANVSDPIELVRHDRER